MIHLCDGDHYVTHKKPEGDERCPGGYYAILYVTNEEFEKNRARLDELVQVKADNAKLSMLYLLRDKK